MKYMGSKNRIAKHIVPIILKSFEENNCKILIDCTVGGGNFLDKIPTNIKRYGVDINSYLIDMWKAVSKGWLPPEIITEDDYNHIRLNKDEDPVMTGYVGFALTYGGKWFGGWSRGKNSKGEARDYVDESRRNALKQFPLFKDVKFKCMNLTEIDPEKKAMLVVDPPYKGTTKYKDDFNYEAFYDWCRDMKAKGNVVFVSEYEMPEDFKCVWQGEINSSLTKETGAKKGLEKLFTL